MDRNSAMTPPPRSRNGSLGDRDDLTPRSERRHRDKFQDYPSRRPTTLERRSRGRQELNKRDASPRRRQSRLSIGRRSERKRETRSRSCSQYRNRRGSRVDSDHDQGNGNKKRVRDTPTPERDPKRGRHEPTSQTDTNLMKSFIDAIMSMKSGTNEKFPSLNNVLPEFDPMAKEQSIHAWLSKVEECKQIYEWSEKQTIHYALPKLTGIAKTWYQSLPTLLYTWEEWKAKLIESFPSTQNYGELLNEMLSKKLRFGESPELYYYAKINLLNRCKLSSTYAVDCIIYGIEDRGIRLGAQAAQFSEPEQLLKFFKSIKPGSSRESDRLGRDKDKRLVPSATSKNLKTNKPEVGRVICFNCNEPGHPSFKCSKPILKCGRCNLLGHLASSCSKPENVQKTNSEKSVLNITSQKSSSIYTFYIGINGSNIQCHLDLGSECTLIRLTDAMRLGITWSTNDLPLLKGLGNIPYQPIGWSKVDIQVQDITERDVEILVISDNLINYPVLLGHSFSERPGIKITKSENKLEISKSNLVKVHLHCDKQICLSPGEIKPIPVQSTKPYTGTTFVTGGLRGQISSEYYLFPGEYELIQGKGCLLAFNLGDKILTLKSKQLITRSKPVNHCKYVYDVKVDNDFEFEPVIGNSISDKQKDIVKSLLITYKSCFSSSLKDLGFTSVVEMDIKLENDDPVVYRPYRLSYSEREDVRRMIEEMLDCGIVKESSSPYASPIVVVKKKNGEKRLCVDYRSLNSRTKRDHYPLPRVEDLLDQLSGHNIFISLDLASGYYQIPISETSQEKTAFVTPDGQYEYTRMPFGLANAPSVFQRAMHKILNKAKVNYVIIYMDDVLIPARSFDEALRRLEEVLILLKEGGLTLKLKKCKFMFDKLDFLGFEVSGNGIQPGLAKTESVSRFPTPSNVHDVRRFLGLASFFRRFVRNFALIVRPLTGLLKKNASWKWGSEQDTAFTEIKDRLTSRPILALYDKNLETQLHTDACKFGVAGILLQKDNTGLWRAVAYYSRQTTIDEQKLHSFELETLAVITALNKFRVYLLGIKFKIITDCNSLRTTLTKRDLVPKIARWWVQLQEFDCEIEYRPGDKMSHVDALSRAPLDTKLEDLHVIDVLNVTTEDWISTVQSSDDEVRRIKEILTDPDTPNVVDTFQNYKLKNGRVYRIVADNTLRWVVPRGSRWQIVKANHDDVGHFGIEKTLDRIRALYWFPKMRAFVTKYVSACLECAHHKMPSGAQQGHLHPIEKVEIPFHTIHADHVGPFNKSKKRNAYILVIIDAFTKFVTLAAVRSTKSSETIKVLKNLVGNFGTPNRIITDRGSCFTSNKFKSFTKSLGIKHILNAVATPRANGQVERSNRTILASLGAMIHGKDLRTWDEHLPDIQLGINTTVHDVTKKSPCELLFGRRVTNPSQGILNDVISDVGAGLVGSIDDARANASCLMQKQSQISKERYDSNRKPAKQYSKGDLVRIVRAIASSNGQSRKLEPKLQGPYRILKVLPNDRYVVEDTPLSRKSRRYEAVIAADKMRPWLSFNSLTDSDSDDEEEKSKCSDAIEDHVSDVVINSAD